MKVSDDPRAAVYLSRHPAMHVARVADGCDFVAFERAAFGTIELTLRSEAAGPVQVHLGEMLNAQGRLEREPPGSIRYRAIVLEARAGTHRYRVEIPADERNTGAAAVLMPAQIGEVLPFRYCEIEGRHAPVGADDVEQVMAQVPFDESASRFTCSDPALQKVWDLCAYSIKATSFCGIYVDGDRERIPYEGDAYINQLGHYCIDASYGMGRATIEHLIQHPTWPTEWLLHVPLMAWEEYLYTGDASLLGARYEDLEVRALLSLAREDGLISTETGRVTPELLTALHLDRDPRDLVDWPPGSFTAGGTGERDGHEMLPVNTVVNAFHYAALQRMADIARTVGKLADADRFGRSAERVTATLNRTLFDEARGCYVDGEGSEHASQHANLFPLAFGMVPPGRVASVLECVQSRGMACSVYAAQHLLDGLYAHGAAQHAYALMTATHDRSWLHMLEQGSTMTLEAWDLRYKNNLDWNHAWGAAPANVIPRRLMGLRPVSPGFRRMEIRPQPGPLTQAFLRHPTVHGPVEIDFVREGASSTSATVTVPPGCEARFIWPGRGDQILDTGTHRLELGD